VGSLPRPDAPLTPSLPAIPGLPWWPRPGDHDPRAG
jgi:hypothetical protein